MEALSQCPTCRTLRQQLADQQARNKDLEDVNERLTQELQALLQSPPNLKNSQYSTDVLEIDLKKSILQQMTTSSSQNDEGETPTLNSKKLQQDLRISKKAEQLAKEKLTQTKRQLEKMEKDFAKYREDSEIRIEGLKNEINILQKHYDQLQNSGNDLMESLGGVEKLLPFNLGGSSAERRENHSQQTAADLMRIIDDYSKQNEAKSREIEVVTQKLDKKATKLSDFKKKFAESESRVVKHKSTLENMKNFLKLLNTNFVKGMKQQNSTLRDQISTAEKEINKEIEQFKANLGPQIHKLVLKKEKDLQSQITSEVHKSQDLQDKLDKLKQTHDQTIADMKKEYEDSLNKQRNELKQKIHSLKAQLRQFSEEQQSKSESKDNLKDQLNAQISQYEKQINILELQLQSEKEKHQLVVSELQKELTQKTQSNEEYRTKESQLTTKLEEQDLRYRSEIEKLFSKLEKTTQGDNQLANQLIQQREALLTADFTAQRESQEKLFSQMQYMYEQKLKEREAEQDRFRTDISLLREENGKIREENLSLKSQANETATKLEKKTQKVKKLETQIAELEKDIIDQSEISKKLQMLEAQNSELNETLEKLKQENQAISQSSSQINEIEIQNIPEIFNQIKQNMSSQGETISQKIIDSIKNLDQVPNFQASLLDADSGHQQQPIPKKKKKVKKGSKSGVPKDQQLDLEVVAEEERFEEPPYEVKPAEEIQPPPAAPSSMNQQEDPVNNMESRESSSRASSYEPQFEGGQEEKKEEPVTQPNSAPFVRPPTLQPARPPPQMAARGRGMAGPFRAPGLSAGPRPRPMFNPMQAPPIAPASDVIAQPVQNISQDIQEEPKIQQPEQKQNILQPAIIQEPIKNTLLEQPSEKVPEKEEVKAPIQSKSEKDDFEPKPLAPSTPAPNTTTPGGQSSGFFGVINNIIGLLTRRKRAYTGRSASSMYYDEKKKRYVIQGEEESDEDVPPPPPPKKKPAVEEEEKKGAPDIKKEEPAATGAEALTRPAFAGALANRGRGRGRGGPMAANRFPQTFGAGQLAQSTFVPKNEEEEEKKSKTPRNLDESRFQDISKPVEEMKDETFFSAQRPLEENSELNISTGGLDLSLNHTQYFDAIGGQTQPTTQVPETILEEEELQQQPLQSSMMFIPSTQQVIRNQEADHARESEWLDKFQQQQEKINNLKYKMSMLQTELRNERDQNELAIEHFTVLCQDLKSKGMDEVEDLQQDISIMREQMRNMVHQIAQNEVRIAQMKENSQYFESENTELRQELSSIKFKLLQANLEKEMLIISPQQQTLPSDEESYQAEEVQALKAQLLDLQIDLDNSRFRVTILEAEKLAKTLDLRDYGAQVERLRQQLGQSEGENQRLQEDLRRVQQEQQQYGQEQMMKLEREKEGLREIMQRVQSEKDRLNEQYRERVAEQESRLKRIESDRQRADLEHSRSLRDREGQLDIMRNQNMSLSQNLNQANEEIKMLQQQLRDLQSKIASLNAKRQSESEQAEAVLKAQLRQVQEMLNQRSAVAEQLAYQKEEMSHELQQMDAMRHKLTENIVYLQNEIRKRDDLLENSSDFELIDEAYDDDSSLIGANEEEYSGAGDNSQREAGHNQVASSQKQSFQMIKRQTTKRKTHLHSLQSQLDDTRAQLKTQIEDKLTSQRRLFNVEHTFRKLIEGVVDITKILDSQHQQLVEQSSMQAMSTLDGEQSTQITTSTVDREFEGVLDGSVPLTPEVLENLQTDESIHKIIAKIFTLQRGYESELSEVKHKLKMQQMQIEESESLKFDIEILNDEKGMLEADLSQLRQTISSLEARLAEQQQVQSEMRIQNDQVLRQAKDSFERTLQREKSDHEQALNSQRADAQRQMDEIHETFKSQMIPAVKQKYQAKLEAMQQELQDLRTALSTELEEEKRRSLNLERTHLTKVSQVQAQLDQANEEAERAKEQLKYAQIQKQEAENTLLQVRSQLEARLNTQAEELNNMRQELEENKHAHQAEIDKILADCNQVVLRLKDKSDQKSNQMKELKTRVQEMIKEKIEECEAFEDRARKAEKKNQDLLEQQAQSQAKSQAADAAEKQAILTRAQQAEARVAELLQEISMNQTMIQDLQQVKPPVQLEDIALSPKFSDEELSALKAEHESLVSQLQQEIQEKQAQLELLAQTSEQQALEANRREQELNQEVQTLQTELDEVRKASQSEAVKFDSDELTQQIEILKQEHKIELEALTAEKEAEIQAITDNFNQQKEQSMTQMREVITQFKDKAKQYKEAAAKEKERATQLESNLSQLSQDLDTCKQQLQKATLANTDQDSLRMELDQVTQDKRILEQQIRELKEQHQLAREEAERQQAERAQAAEDRYRQQIEALEDQLTPLQQQRDGLMDQLEELKGLNEVLSGQVREIVRELQEDDDQEVELSRLIPKVKELLHNYAEDKRTLRQLLTERENERETLTQERDQLYTEKESVIIEKSRLLEKLGGTQTGQLEKKVRNLEEEASLIRTQYQIQIQSFVDEIDTLKNKLSRYEASVGDAHPEKEQKSQSSFNQTSVLQEGDEGDTTARQHPNFDQSHISKAVDQSNIQQRSGIFNSLAYFFLTETEISGAKPNK